MRNFQIKQKQRCSSRQRTSKKLRKKSAGLAVVVVRYGTGKRLVIFTCVHTKGVAAPALGMRAGAAFSAYSRHAMKRCQTLQTTHDRVRGPFNTGLPRLHVAD